MLDRVRRLYEMFLRVLTFMSANTADFQNVPFVAATVAALQAEIETLANLGVQKIITTSASKDSVISKGDARDNLRDAVKDIADVWKSLPNEIKRAENKFRFSDGNNDQKLIAVGKSFADEGEAVKDIFFDHGMPTDFITDLRNKIMFFEQAVIDSEQKRGERAGTNAAFNEPVRKGKAQVAKLAPAVKRKYRANPQKLAEWLVASHIERAAKSIQKTNGEQPEK